MAFNVQELNHRNTNYKVIKGDTFIQRIDMFTDDLLLYLPKEGDTVTFSIFNKYTDEEPLFERQIQDTDMILTLTAQETAQMKLGNYVYTVKIIYASDEVVDTFMNGAFSIVTAEGVS